MRCAALLALLVPAGLLLSGAALAQPQMPVLLAPLPSGDNRADELPPLEGPTISRSGVVALNADVLAQYFTDRAEGLPPQAPVTLQLFEDTAFVLVPEALRSDFAETTTIEGHALNDRTDRALLVLRDGRVTGDVLLGERQYEIRPLGDGLQTVAEVNQTGFVDELPPSAPELGAAPEADSQLDPNWPPVIDVLVAYTPAAAAASGGVGAIEDLIVLAVNETNTSYVNSGILQRLRLAGALQVDYPESGNIELDRNRLQAPSDGFADSVLVERDLKHADLVSFWVEHVNGGYCGIAYIMQTPAVNFAPYGVSVVKRSCATGYYSFGHELGHLMSARHDRYVDPTNNSPFSYNHGFYIPAKGWRDVMAYNDGCAAQGATCKRIPYWANPDTQLSGVRLGVAEGQPNAADNRKTLNTTAQIVASFR